MVDISDGTIIADYKGGHQSLQYHGCVKFSTDNRTLIQGSEDNSIALYDVSSKLIKGKLLGHTMPVISIDVQTKPLLLPGSDKICSGSADGTIKIWTTKAS
jgi:WD40 repeat protein